MTVVAITARYGRRAARYRTIRGDIAHNDKAVRADLDVVAHCDRTEENCTGSDEDVVTNCRMALAHVLAGTTESDVVKHDAVATDHRCLTYHYSGAMVTKISFAYSRARMNLKASKETGYLR